MFLGEQIDSVDYTNKIWEINENGLAVIAILWKQYISSSDFSFKAGVYNVFMKIFRVMKTWICFKREHFALNTPWIL